MLPLWRDEVGVLLSPAGVVLNRMSRGLRPRCVADEYVPVAAGTEDQGWDAPLDVLRRLLRQSRWQQADVRVVVADSWVRYAMVPWQRALRGNAERAAHAWHVLSSTYGDMGSDWRLAMADEPAGVPQLACAMPAALIESLSATLAEAHLRFRSLQPRLVAAFGRWRQMLPADGGWFVTLDTGSLAAAHISADGWEQVRAVRIGSDWAAELRRLRTFGRLTAGQPGSSRVFVDAPLWVRKLCVAQDTDIQMLQEEREDVQGTVHMLLALKGLHA